MGEDATVEYPRAMASPPLLIRRFRLPFLARILGHGLLVGLLVAPGCRSTTPAERAAPTASNPQPDAPAREESAPVADAPSTPSVAVGTQGAVASQAGPATEVGMAILRKGGNAVDAAIAVGLALAVVHPSAGNIGGGGFMVIRMADGTTAALDYREQAPAKATRDMYLDKKGNPTGESLVGAKAAGIPGSVAGYGLAHEKFGSLPWKDLVAPAVRLAREGHALDSHHAEDLSHGVEGMVAAKHERSADYFRKSDKSAYEAGDIWKQPELAATLDTIAQGGAQAFYKGPLAERIVAAVQKEGGIWSAADLASYRAKNRDPIVFPYRGHEVITMPPPSAGGVVLRQLMAASEALDFASHPWHSVEQVHLYIEACRRTYADRNLLLGDPDFVKLPLERLLDVSYVQERMADIDRKKATPSSDIDAGVPAGGKESEQTTHYSVVDAQGNAVASTTTLNLGFGARVVVEGAGFLLNNEMNDFSVKPGSPNVFGLVQGEPNKIEPGKRMLSSMTPTIVTKDGKLRAVVGTPGGPTITTTVFQIILALVDYGKPLDEAVEATRLHHQWLPDMIWTEERIDPALAKGLEALGHELRKRDSMGHANCIEILEDGRRRAVADVERDGGLALAD